MTSAAADEKVVVVGASLAGLRTCEALRQLGFTGSIIAIDEEHHFPYDRPPLSKDFLAGKKEREAIALRSPDQIDALQIDLRLGLRATALHVSEKRISCSDGSEIAFDHLVIATGAAPRMIAGFNAFDGVFALRTLDDALELRGRINEPGCRLVIVGGGVLGMEIAATALGIGAAVTVVEPLDRPFGRVLDEGVGGALLAEHRNRGVKVLTNTGVTRLLGGDRVEQVELSNGEVLDADVVVVAIGVAPSVDWLEGAGLSLENGIVCDDRLQAAPGIYAAGDVARWPFPLGGRLTRIEHWTNASEQGAHVAAVIVKGPEVAGPFSPIPYFWSDHFDLKIQAIGLPRPDDEVAIVFGSLESHHFVACYGREGKVVGAIGFNQPRQLMALRKLIVEGASFADALALPLPQPPQK